MAANTIITSIVTGGSNNHTTTAEEANSVRTDFGTAGVIGSISLNSGSGGTGSFCVNQNTGSNLAINILAGSAQFAITPSSQDSQMLRPTAVADYTAYTINSNASGSTKFDWIYLSGNATNANTPSSTADNVVSIVTSRSSSNTVDNGTPPTYGLLLAIITVANAATAVTNSNITDKRVNASLSAQAGSLTVTQNGTGTDAQIVAAGVDSNVNITLLPKGTGTIKTSPVNRIDWSALPLGAVVQVVTTGFPSSATTTTVIPNDDTIPQITEGGEFMTQAITPKATTDILVIEAVSLVANSGADYIIGAIFQDSTANALSAMSLYSNDSNSTRQIVLGYSMAAGTASATTFRVRLGPSGANTLTFNGSAGARKFGAINKSYIKITEYKA